MVYVLCMALFFFPVFCLMLVSAKMCVSGFVAERREERALESFMGSADF